LLWRLVGVVALLTGISLTAWLLTGGPARLLRRTAPGGSAGPLGAAAQTAVRQAMEAVSSVGDSWSARLLIVVVLGGCGACLLTRTRARLRSERVRLRVNTYRTDRASAEAVVAMFESLHKRLLVRWWRRMLHGQPSLSVEVHYRRAGMAAPQAWLAVCCPAGSVAMVEAALRTGYPNCRLQVAADGDLPATLVRLKKRAEFIKRVKVLDRLQHEHEPPVNRLLTAMAACGQDAVVQLALTPAPSSLERLAKRIYKRHEAHLSRLRREHLLMRDRSVVEEAELRGALDVQHRPLFFADVRVLSSDRAACERVASELRAEGAENSLVERGTRIRHGWLGLYRSRVMRGEGNALPGLRKGVFGSTELAALWHVPSTDYTTVPFARAAVPLAPAPPAIMRPADGEGALRDSLGPVSIHPHLRKHNTAVPGAVEQGKTSYLVATVAEDLRRARCAVIVLDPKGDAADAAVSLVPPQRTCTLLDLANPTCGFNPLAVDAPADVIADYVVGALKNLFTDVDIRASSDRYLRNAIIAVLAADTRATLWDAARLLSVGQEGYAYRRRVGARVRTLPAFKEIADFFTSELSAQLADARSMTTAKLDAPVNKLARLLNSQSIKRVLLNESLTIDLDRLIAQEEVLVVKGALGTMGAGNTSVVMQLLVGMLDAALARQQDLVPESSRVTVALKVDEAPLVLNRGFAETIALKRSAGLETVACWQADAQWSDREIFEQLDALFAHRVYFATASARDARAAAKLTMAEFSDSVRPGIGHLSPLGHPDARLHLPKHHAIASWSTPQGRQASFIAQTVPLTVDQARIALHAERQMRRGARPLSELHQPHWLRSDSDESPAGGPHEAIASKPAQPDQPEDRLPAAVAESYGELVDLDRAHSVRWAKRVAAPRALAPDPLDWELLALVAALGHALTSQLHRHLNPTKAPTTTQRRLKRLSDAGLLQRFQFHRRDGGGVPMCYVISDAGRRLLTADGRLGAAPQAPAQRKPRPDAPLRQARHEVHVAGWLLALARLTGRERCSVLGRGQAAISPPARRGPDGAAPIGPDELRLPGGQVPHDFLRTDPSGRRVEVDRFETVRPDALLQVIGEPTHRWGERPDGTGRDGAGASTLGAGPSAPGAGMDIMVEFDDRVGSDRWIAKLERYDHFLAGWSVHTARYGRRMQAVPLVVFVCRDRARARECARRADPVLSACRAYAGEYPFDWRYPGRDAMLFAAERDAHEGLGCAHGVPHLPPGVRVDAARGDPSAGETTAERRTLPLAAPRRGR
jgi:hypothetical protein